MQYFDYRGMYARTMSVQGVYTYIEGMCVIYLFSSNIVNILLITILTMSICVRLCVCVCVGGGGGGGRGLCEGVCLVWISM